jgi:tRNA(Ile)-lysidine synthase
MKEESRLLRKLVRLQRERSLVPPHCSILIALSGGVDSVALSHALLELKDFLKIKRLGAAHFNHGLRDSADRDQLFCEELAGELGIEFYTEKVPVGEIAKKERENLEETARKLRYAFLRRVKEREGYDLIATAHHLSDLVETVLIWIMRGSGLEGLTGFSPREGDVVRPFFTASREEILDFARARGLRWVEDPSNYDTSFVRNKLRHRVIPLLKEINPNLEEGFLRLWTIIEAENELLEELSRELLERSIRGKCLEVDSLKGEHPALIRRVIRKFTGVKNLSKVQQIMNLLKRGGEVNLGGGIKAVRRGGLLCLKKDS